MDATQALTSGSSIIDLVAEELHLPSKITHALKEVVDTAEIVGGSLSGNAQMAISGAMDMVSQVMAQVQAGQGKTEYAPTGGASMQAASKSTSSNSSSQMTSLITKLMSVAVNMAGSATGTLGSTGVATSALTAATTAASSAASAASQASKSTTLPSAGSGSANAQLVSLLSSFAQSVLSSAGSATGSSAVTGYASSALNAATTVASTVTQSATAGGTSSATNSHSDMMLFIALLEASSQTTSTNSKPATPTGTTSSSAPPGNGAGSTGAKNGSASASSNAPLGLGASIGEELIELLQKVFPQLNSAKPVGSGTTAGASSTTAAAATIAAAPASTATATDPRVKALQALSAYYSLGDSAGSAFGAIQDNQLGREDLQAIISAQPGRYPLALVSAANYFTQHPADFSAILKNGSAYASSTDVSAALAKATPAAPTAAGSTHPAIDPLADQRVQAFQILRQDFGSVDGAGSGGMQDGQFGMGNLEALESDNTVHADVKSAAEFLIDHPDEFKALTNSDGFITKAAMDNAYTTAQATQKSSNAAKAAAVSTSPSSTAATRSSSGSNSVPNSDTDVSSQMQQVLANPNLSIDEKVEQILMLSQQDADDDVINIAQKMQDQQAKKAGLSKDDSDQSELSKTSDDLTQLGTQLQEAMQRKQEMATLLSNFVMKQGETAMSAINNIAR